MKLSNLTFVMPEEAQWGRLFMRSICFVWTLLVLGPIAGAQTIAAQTQIAGLPTGDPDAASVSRERLERVMLLLDGEVKEGRIAGAVFGIVRHGKLVWLKATGFRDKAANLPMTTDALFPLASMTKPIASVAAMTLVEQGKLALRDPVANYLPAFKDVRVAKEWQGGAPGTAGAIATEPLARPITIQDLLRHTAGLVNGRVLSRTPVRVAYVDAGVYQEPQTLAEEVDKIAKLPLAYQPGTRWDYSQSTDVLARVVEVVSGKRFDEFVAETVTGPLGMVDTSYNVPEAKWPRVALPAALPNGTLPPTQDTRHITGHFQGNGGLVSSAPDYLRFSMMLLGRGALDRVRVLGGGTVDLMRVDALGSIPHDTESGTYLLGPGYGFGLGFSVRIADGESAFPGTKGTFGWGGAFGTQFVVDPVRDMAAVLMINQINQFPRIFEMFNTLVYQTMID
jgi:CubicO group peptidase (beta-lactamase class C family)